MRGFSLLSLEGIQDQSGCVTVYDKSYVTTPGLTPDIMVAKRQIFESGIGGNHDFDEKTNSE